MSFAKSVGTHNSPQIQNNISSPSVDKSDNAGSIPSSFKNMERSNVQVSANRNPGQIDANSSSGIKSKFKSMFRSLTNSRFGVGTGHFFQALSGKSAFTAARAAVRGDLDNRQGSFHLKVGDNRTPDQAKWANQASWVGSIVGFIPAMICGAAGAIYGAIEGKPVEQQVEGQPPNQSQQIEGQDGNHLRPDLDPEVKGEGDQDTGVNPKVEFQTEAAKKIFYYLDVEIEESVHRNSFDEGVSYMQQENVVNNDIGSQWAGDGDQITGGQPDGIPKQPLDEQIGEMDVDDISIEQNNNEPEIPKSVETTVSSLGDMGIDSQEIETWQGAGLLNGPTCERFNSSDGNERQEMIQSFKDKIVNNQRVQQGKDPVNLKEMRRNIEQSPFDNKSELVDMLRDWCASSNPWDDHGPYEERMLRMAIGDSKLPN